MLAKLKQISTKARMASVLLLLVMLPAIFYSVYEFTTLSRSEELIADVYRRQLDVVLFSLNQYSWDVANSWATTIDGVLSGSAVNDKDRNSLFAGFLHENSGIQCLFVCDSECTNARVRYTGASSGNSIRITPDVVTTSLRKQVDVLDRLLRLQASGYRKIEPLLIGGESGKRSLALVFVAGPRGDNRQIVGIVLNEERFVRDILARKMGEAAGENFVLSVNRKSTGQTIFATEESLQGEARQTKDLWLFPDYVIGIRLKGETIDEVVRSRFYRNLILIGLLNVVLVVGVWVVYKTVRHEIELAQMKSDFVSNVSHEIKTPLALIRMFAETLQLKRVRSEAKKQEYYDTIVQETERLTRLINNILNFSRMEAGKKEYRFEPVNLNEVVRSVLKNYGDHLEREGFTVSVEVNHELPSINADTGAVSEAILNIIDNSVKYSRERKHLQVSTGLDGTKVYVDIEDQGIGIDAQQQKKIFEKFYRASSGLVHDTKGTGLGLALVKHIMDAHRGAVSLRSEVGKGSTFRLAFPMYSNKNV